METLETAYLLGWEPSRDGMTQTELVKEASNFIFTSAF